VGLHTVTVPNANGNAATWPEALLAVRRPEIASVSPDLLCAAAEGRVSLTGQLFLRFGSSLPRVVAQAEGAEPIELSVLSMDGCRSLPGDSGYEACTTLDAGIPAGTLPSGETYRNYTLSVDNPGPASCHSTETVLLTLVPAPTLAAVEPGVVCTAQGDVLLVITGNGFLVIDGETPTISIDGSTYLSSASECEPTPGPKKTTMRCTRLEVTLPEGALQTGEHQVSVMNPAPAGCVSSNVLTLPVWPPPTVTGVAPHTLCAGGGTLSVTGSGFRPGAKVTLGSGSASSVTVASDTELSATFDSTGLVVGGPYDLTVTNDDSCSATLPAAVTVTLGPQIFFADPPVVWNGITTTILLYGSGFTGSIASIAIRPTGTSDPGAALAFSYNPARPTRVQAGVPEGTPPGEYDILFADQSSCVAVLARGLRVVSDVTLELLSVTPLFGSTSEETAVTVRANSQTNGGFSPVPRLYLSPQSGTMAEALQSVNFIDAGRVTAIVPGGLPEDTYDLIAVNPDGSVGLLVNAFKVVAAPSPSISGISPGSIPNQSNQQVTISGSNFRDPLVKLLCLDISTNAQVDQTPQIVAHSETSITVNVNASGFSQGAVCVVRVIAQDNGTYGDYASLVITNLAQNLTDFRQAPSMSIPRRALGATANQATPAARFIYAVGGDNGATASALASVEVAPVDIFGQAGSFFTQRNSLQTPRSFAPAVSVGRCIYVVGGISGDTILSSVERACVLDPKDRPEITDLDLVVAVDSGSGSGLGAGLYYYQVAALMPSSHALNPGGETLPSEPFPVLLPDLPGRKVKVTVYWALVPGAVGYRIYRTPTANAPSSEMRLLEETSGSATSLTDTGLDVKDQVPQRLGATGAWHVAASMTVPRQGAGAAIAPDPGDPTGTLFHLYVFGGKSGASQAETSCERLSLTVNPDGSQTVGTFVDCGRSMAQARWQMALYEVGNEDASFVTPPTRFLYASGGVAANGHTLVPDVDAFEILSGGGLGPRVSVDSMQPYRAGYGFTAVNNFLFAFGGTSAQPNDTASSAKICAAPASGTCPTGPPALTNWDNVSGHLVSKRYLLGSAVQSGFIYLLGGQTDTQSATNTVEYTIW